MRIRKNANRSTSPLRYPESSPCAGAIIQTHYCNLNQSPWDAIDFTPPKTHVPPHSPPPLITASELVDKIINNIGSGSLEDTPIVESKDNGKGLQCRRKRSKPKSLSSYSAEALDRSRRRKTSSLIPNEFYYYSGFGPSWGKRRGESSSENINPGYMDPNIEHGQEMSPALLTQIDDEDTVSDDEREDEFEKREKGRKRGRKPIKERPLKSLV